MYDHLVGEVIEKRLSRAVLRCGGVGYECKVSVSTATALQVGQTQQVFTILHVVDGSPSLLGFASRAERELARRILGVTGVGPTIALALLSVFEPEDLVAAIAQADTAALRRVKGIGQKTAERLCLELRDVLPKLELASGPRAASPTTRPAEDAIAALVTLGYSEKEARDKVEKARRDAAATDTETLVKAVLQM